MREFVLQVNITKFPSGLCLCTSKVSNFTCTHSINKTNMHISIYTKLGKSQMGSFENKKLPSGFS